MSRSLIETRRRNDTAEFLRGIAVAGRLVWRWHTGRRVIARAAAPAAVRPATDIRTPADHAWRAHHIRRRRRRGLYRTAATYTVLGSLYGLLAARTLTLWLLAAAVVLAAAWTVLHVISVRHPHHRDIVAPLTRDLTAAIGPPRDVQVDPDHATVRVDLPHAFSVTDQEKVTELVHAGVPGLSKTGSPTAEWKRTRILRRPYVEYAQAVPMPGFVAWALIREAADACAEHEVILGRTRTSPYKISVDNDSPHIGLSMPSGEGKSVTARLLAAQLAHHGALAVILDRKLTSHQWAAGLPNVAYARSVEQVHQLCLWLAAEVDRRNAIAVQFADREGKVHANPGPRLGVILEELNATAAELKAYWKSIGGKGISPAVVALDKVAFTGRAVLINLVYIGQRLSAKATGGGSADSRENLGIKLMSPNVAKSTWKMLIGDQHAQPEGSDTKGRLYVVGGKTSTEVQCGFMTGDEAAEYAQSGRIAEVEDDMPCLGPLKVLAPYNSPERALQDAAGITGKLVAELVPDSDTKAVQASDLGDVPDIEGSEAKPGTRLALVPPLLVTGPEAFAQGLLPGWQSWDSAHKHIMRDPDGPRPEVGKDGQVLKQGNAPRYNAIKLGDWVERKRGAAPDERRDA